MPKPSAVPNWADSVTGLTRRTDPAASADDGLEPGDRWPAQWHNYQLGLLGDWAKYVNERFGARQFNLGPQDMEDGSGGGWSRNYTTSISGPWEATTSPKQLIANIPLEVGDKITAVSIRCQDGGAGNPTHVLTAELYKAASGTDTSQSAVATSTGAGSGVQSLPLASLSGAVVAADEVWFIQIGTSVAGATRRVFSITVTVERP